MQDRMVPPNGQRMMADQAKAKRVEIQNSHAVMLAHPHKVAPLIETVAEQE